MTLEQHTNERFYDLGRWRILRLVLREVGLCL